MLVSVVIEASADDWSIAGVFETQASWRISGKIVHHLRAVRTQVE